MPDDPNDLSQDPEPFDLSAMLPPSVAPAPAGPARPAPHLPQHAKPGRGGIAAQAALAAIVPLIAKRGGPLAVSALLQGFQHAQAGQAQVSNQQAQQDFENQRQLESDQRARDVQQATDQYRQQGLEQQRRTQAAALVKDFATKLSAAETKEQVEGLSQAFRYAARVVGLRPEAVEGLIAKAAPTPATTVERQVRKVVGGLTPEQVDQYLQGGLSITIPGQKLPVPVDVWSQYIVAGVDPVSGKRTVAVKKPDVPNTPEEQFYQQYAVEHGAKSFGALPTAVQAQARTQWSGAGRAPTAQRGSDGVFGPSTGAGVTDDVKAVVDAIVRGDQPPTLQGFYGNTLKVRAELGRRGYDLSTANMDYQATQQHWKTLNGAQQTKMRQAVDNASHSLDVIEELAGQWKGGRFPVLNRGRLAAARNGALGPDAQRIATALESQIADVTSELANVYMGGNSPTDHAMGLAAKNLQAEWSEPQLRALIDQQRTNLRIRSNSIKNVAAITPSSQAAPAMPHGAPGPNPFRH